MASRAHFVFATDPETLGRFYTEVLRLDPPKQFRINNRPGWIYNFTGGELHVRQSTKGRPPEIDEPLPYQLPAGVDLEQLAQSLNGQAAGLTRGTTPKGIPYIELVDPAGVPWRIMSHGR
ncbi:MAG TPA: hypothetical protein VEI97_10895 [bacterium]|nr:hypothetical protein [bacterium]